MKRAYSSICFGVLLFCVGTVSAQSIPAPIAYSTTYSYDDLGRLTGADTANQLTTAYTYDATGRMTSLAQTAFSGVFVEPEESELPSTFALHPAYPNPFNPQTTIQFDLPGSAQVQIEVFDALGRLVRVLENGVVEAGRHEVVLNGNTLSSGVYFVVMNAKSRRLVQMLTLLK